MELQRPPIGAELQRPPPGIIELPPGVDLSDLSDLSDPFITGQTARLPRMIRKVEKSVRTHSFTPPDPKRLMVVIRMAVWIWVLIRAWVLWRLPFGASKGLTDQQRAEHLASLIASMGGAAAYFGKCAGMRLDLLPREYALALSNIEDPAPPIPIEYVAEKVEKAMGVSLVKGFKVFDPEPIASTTTDCVYQAILRSGHKVAVRVLREDAVERVNTEIHAIKRVVSVLRQLFPKREQLLQRVKDEVPRMLLPGIDFVRRARAQRLFKRELKRWRIKEVTVAKVYLDLSSEHVIVTEFVRGVWLHEVIGAVEQRNLAALERIRELEIRPSECAQNLLRFSWWASLESFMLPSAPHASQLVVRPGGQIVLIDIGTSAALGQHQRRLLMTSLVHFMEHDFETAADLLLQLVSPLPPIDVHELTSRVRGALWVQLVAIERKDSPWWERTLTCFWLSLFEILREYGVDVSIEIALAAQAQSVFGHLAFRMKPRMKLIPEFQRYRYRQIKREAALFRREFGNPKVDGGSRFMARPADIRNMGERGLLSIESLLERAPLTYLSMTHKAAYSVSELLRVLTLAVQFATIYLIVKVVIAWVSGASFDVATEFREMLTEPLFIFTLVILGLAAIRRILFRLDDIDRDYDR